MRALVLSCCLALAGCHLFKDPAPSNYPSTEVYAEDTTLGARDVFDIKVFRHDEMSGTYSVSDDGTINFPDIGVITVSGKTPDAVALEIQKQLADGYLVNPSVSVLVKEYKSKSISILGQVRKPTTIQYSAGLSIVDAISQAGGFTQMAYKNAVKVTRNEPGPDGKAKPISYTVPVENIASGGARPFFLRPGDNVYVPERWY